METQQTTTEPTTEQRIQALAKHLGCDISEVSESRFGDNCFDAEGGEFLVLTDDEADEKAKQEIKESLWAFNASFIAFHTKNGLDDAAEKALAEMQGRLCESANPIVEALIEDMDHFISDAIMSDGRGHFISRYDGEESVQDQFFIFRTN